MINKQSFISGSLFAVTIGLVMLGVIMVLSTSFMAKNVYELMGKQLIWFSIGLAGMFYLSNTDYNIWERYSRWILVGTIVLLLLVFLFPEVKGARRWIRFLGFTIQPSDFAKLAIILYLSSVWAERPELLESFKGIFWPLAVAGGTLLLVLLEPNHSTTFFIGLLILAVWFTAGGKIVHLVPVFILLVVGVAVALYKKPVLFGRIDAFFHPDEHQAGSAYQFLAARVGFAHGGFWGVGIGEGMQKMGFLPEAHNDYIFSTMGEELGFFKCSLVILAYMWIVSLGYMTALKCTNPFGRLVAAGCTTAIGLQAALNLAVVTGCLPTTGMSLPFISYGGSSLLISMAMIGVLTNIAKDTFGGEELPAGVKEGRKARYR